MTTAYNIVDISFRHLARKSERVQDLSLEEILNDVCQALGINPKTVKMKNNQREQAMARKVFSLVTVRKTLFPQVKIAKLIGYRDHTTVQYNLRVIKDLVETNDPVWLKFWNRFLDNSELFTKQDFI